MEKKKLIIVCTSVVVAVAALGVGVYVGLETQKEAEEAETLLEEEQEQEVQIVVEDLTYDFSTTDDVKDLDAIRQEYGNEDIYAWLTIPGTTVDFPVLQSEEDNYYLDHCVDGTEGYPGSIYTNAIEGKDFTRANTIIYGHNMKNGSYFGQLHLFEDEEFFNENKEIYIYLENRKLTYEIIIASQFSNEYLPDIYSFSMALDAENFLDDVVAYAPDDETTNIADDVSLGDWEQIITLSTCVAGEGEKRYMVIGKLVEVEMYPEN